LRKILLLLLWHMALLNGFIAVPFKLRLGMAMLGKDKETGVVPLWSYLLYPGFHFPTWLYTRIHRMKDRAKGIEVATEVAPGWYVGGRYGVELDIQWSGTVDLTCEFPEGCRANTEQYLLLRCWDGVPPPPELLERAAEFAVAAREKGNVMVHCAHGRGRSTTVMCACLVRAGLYATWEQAFQAIKEKRNVCNLNRNMRAALTAWQAQHSKIQ